MLLYLSLLLELVLFLPIQALFESSSSLLASWQDKPAVFVSVAGNADGKADTLLQEIFNDAKILASDGSLAVNGVKVTIYQGLNQQETIVVSEFADVPNGQIESDIALTILDKAAIFNGQVALDRIYNSVSMKESAVQAILASKSANESSAAAGSLCKKPLFLVYRGAAKEAKAIQDLLLPAYSALPRYVEHVQSLSFMEQFEPFVFTLLPPSSSMSSTVQEKGQERKMIEKLRDTLFSSLGKLRGGEEGGEGEEEGQQQVVAGPTRSSLVQVLAKVTELSSSSSSSMVASSAAISSVAAASAKVTPGLQAALERYWGREGRAIKAMAGAMTRRSAQLQKLLLDMQRGQGEETEEGQEEGAEEDNSSPSLETAAGEIIRRAEETVQGFSQLLEEVVQEALLTLVQEEGKTAVSPLALGEEERQALSLSAASVCLAMARRYQAVVLQQLGPLLSQAAIDLFNGLMQPSAEEVESYSGRRVTQLEALQTEVSSWLDRQLTGLLPSSWQRGDSLSIGSKGSSSIFQVPFPCGPALRRLWAMPQRLVDFQRALAAFIATSRQSLQLQGILPRPWRAPVDLSLHAFLLPSQHPLGYLLGPDHGQDALKGDQTLRYSPLLAQVQQLLSSPSSPSSSSAGSSSSSSSFSPLSFLSRWVPGRLGGLGLVGRKGRETGGWLVSAPEARTRLKDLLASASSPTPPGQPPVKRSPLLRGQAELAREMMMLPMSMRGAPPATSLQQQEAAAGAGPGAAGQEAAEMAMAAQGVVQRSGGPERYLFWGATAELQEVSANLRTLQGLAQSLQKTGGIVEVAGGDEADLSEKLIALLSKEVRAIPSYELPVIHYDQVQYAASRYRPARAIVQQERVLAKNMGSSSK